MQLPLFGVDPLLDRIRAKLKAVFVPETWQGDSDPLPQLIHSIVSSRTPDRVSWDAFQRLSAAFPDWDQLGDVAAEQIESMISTVTHADNKARQLRSMIRVLRTWPGKLDLSFLREMPAEEAMDRLRELPGVGVKSAATALNFSRLKMRALVVDTHVHRVAKRLGLVGRRSLPEEAYQSLMESLADDWTAEDLFELHWLLKPLGQKICTAQMPLCGRCPLKPLCPRIDVEPRGGVLPFPPKAN